MTFCVLRLPIIRTVANDKDKQHFIVNSTELDSHNYTVSKKIPNGKLSETFEVKTGVIFIMVIDWII